MNTMTYTTQHIWTWWIALYLFFGGLGAATLTITFLTDMYCRPHRKLVLWGALSGVVLLGISSAVLFGHLLHHAAVIYVLNPLVFILKPDSWIAWGTQFILWMMVWGMLYALPYMRETPLFMRIPVVRGILQWPLVNWLSACCMKRRRIVGWLASINGIGTAVYTGLLIQSFPAVALWHNPGVPLLFTVSAFSTAFAYLLLLLNIFITDENDQDIRHRYERMDLILIATELVILFSFFNYTLSGSESGYRSAQLLWGDWGWLIGFIGFGLLVPFMIELKGVTRGWRGRFPTVAAAVLVLMGGYLLRHYFMYAGVYAYPW
ncbi:MAG: polysulfide reductase NrfD [Sulfuricella sp.]|nr:polysulfide reductase NrfD [Sulfuricella sp.]